MKSKSITKTLLALSMLATFSGAMANDEQYLNSDPIDINGYVQPKVEATDQELETIRGDVRKAKALSNINKKKTKNYKKLVDETEKLSETSEEMIEERLAAQKEMKKYNEKIDCLMGRLSGPQCDPYKKQKEDTVSVAQSAPVVEKKVEEVKGDGFGETIKILPYSGLKTFMSENENLEANINAGIKVESNMNSRFSVGIGFEYTSMTTKDYASNSYIAQPYQGLYNQVYNGREIEYKNMNFNIYSKFFFSKNKRFRPYAGAGIGYNRTNMAYKNNRSLNGGYGYNYNFGKEEVLASSVNANLMLGSEVIFTDTFGAVLEFDYKKGLGQSISQDYAVNAYNAPDQQRLEALNNELGEANVLSLYVGMLVQF